MDSRISYVNSQNNVYDGFNSINFKVIINKIFFSERGECNPHRMDDEFLIKFLRARNFIPKRAHRLVSVQFLFL